GIAASVADRAGSLRKQLASFTDVQLLDRDVSTAVWVSVRDVTPFAAAGPLGQWPVWRIICPPASGAMLGQSLTRQTGGEAIYDWAGGLIWLALPPSADARAVFV